MFFPFFTLLITYTIGCGVRGTARESGVEGRFSEDKGMGEFLDF